MTLTTVTMILLVVWAIRNISRELGLTELAKTKIKGKCNPGD